MQTHQGAQELLWAIVIGRMCVSSQVLLCARYHHWLGFAGSVLYVRDDLLADLVQQVHIQAAVHEKILYLVRWDDVPPFPNDVEQIYDQVELPPQHSASTLQTATFAVFIEPKNAASLTSAHNTS
jgi:hypothetical protein